MPASIQQATACRSIGELFVRTLDLWASRAFLLGLPVITVQLENVEVDAHPGLLLKVLYNGVSVEEYTLYLPDYLSGVEIATPDALRQLGPALTYAVNFRRDGVTPKTAEDAATEFIGVLAAGFLVWLGEYTALTVDALDTESRPIDGSVHYQATVIAKLSGLSMTAGWYAACDCQGYAASDDPRVITYGPWPWSSPLVALGVSELGSMAQSLSDIAHTRVDVQLNNGGPSWSMSGGARIDGGGGG